MNNKVIDCKRIEDKYIISYDKALLLKNAFNKVLSKDVHSQEKAYVVRSLYFDSIFVLSNISLKGDFSYNWYNIFYNIDNWYKIKE